MRLRHRSAARTHVGRVRTVNEDTILVRDDVGLWLVADGMGGHANGQWASQTLAAAAATIAPAGDAETRGGAMLGALEAGNRAIVAAAQAAGQSMGTTAVLAHLHAGEMLCLWVGDSRCYRWRDGTLEMLTHDHSVVQELIDRGSLAPEDAEGHPMAHVLSRAVGTEAELRYDGFRVPVTAGERFLLCSDGITKVLADATIAGLMGLPSIAVVADRLIEATLDAGAPDNASLIVVAIEETTAVLGLRS